MARTQRRRSGAASAAASDAAAQTPPRRRRDNLPRPAAPAAAPAAGVPRAAVAAPRRRRRNPLAVLGRFEPRWIADIVSELRKVTWPSWEETRHLTIVVAIVATVIGVSLGLIDLGFGWVMEKLLF